MIVRGWHLSFALFFVIFTFFKEGNGNNLTMPYALL